MRNTIFPLILFLIICTVDAQNLKIELPLYAGHEVVLSVRHAIKSDTILRMILDNKGEATMNLNHSKHRIGLATITISPNVNYEFVLSPSECPIIRCVEQTVNTQNTQVLNSPENKNIDILYTRFLLLRQKKDRLLALSQLYNFKEKYSDDTRNELIQVDKALRQFYDSLECSQFYGAKFIEIRKFINETINNAWQSDSIKTEVRKYTINHLDVNHLYGSGMYFDYLNGLSMYVYNKESIFHNEFGYDMIQVLTKIEPLDVFSNLTIDLLTICEKLSWDSEAEIIVDYLIDSKRIINPNWKLKMFITQYGLKKGKKAPILITGNSVLPLKTFSFNDTKCNTLLIFYETGCEHCDKLIEKMIINYPDFEQKGLRVVTISADVDKTVFEKSSNSFPWPDKLCDLQSFGGQNFLNYGIIGVPTLIYVDNKGYIERRSAKLED